MLLCSLSQCSNSGLILASSSPVGGDSNGKTSICLCKGWNPCHVLSSTMSIANNPLTIVYSFHG